MVIDKPKEKLHGSSLEPTNESKSCLPYWSLQVYFAHMDKNKWHDVRVLPTKWDCKKLMLGCGF